jgi:hypothetical protein
MLQRGEKNVEITPAGLIELSQALLLLLKYRAGRSAAMADRSEDC